MKFPTKFNSYVLRPEGELYNHPPHLKDFLGIALRTLPINWVIRINSGMREVRCVFIPRNEAVFSFTLTYMVIEDLGLANISKTIRSILDYNMVRG